MTGAHLEVPAALVASHARYFGERGQAWLAALPGLAADVTDRWSLRRDGPVACGNVALVLPVRCTDGTAAVVKFQPVDEEMAGEPAALRAWAGHGAVRLLRHDPATGALLLERLDATRTLASVRDDLAALTTLSELLGRLTAVAAPTGIRRLADIAAGMLDRLPRAPDPLLARCADAVRDVLAEPGDRLLHWDLHYDNVLATYPGDERGPWLAIDPKPLAGDPGFELLAALHNRWDDVVATGDVSRAVLRRFDLMTDVLALDRQRATGWTLARVLQNALWDLGQGTPSWHTGPDAAIARTLIAAPASR